MSVSGQSPVSGPSQSQLAQDQAEKADQRQQQAEREHARNLQAAADQREVHGKNILRANQENRTQWTDDAGSPQAQPGDSINVQYFT